MSFLLLAMIGVAVALWFWFARTKPEPSQPEVRRRVVACKKCSAQIAINNAKLDQEFSLKCDACKTRSIYKAIDLVLR